MAKTKPSPTLIPAERIERAILLIRSQTVMLDADLAESYGVETKTLNRAVARNRDRFPADFMFQLTKDEFDDLRSQFGTSSWGGRRYPPYAFTEHGVLMLSSVLRSKRAVAVNIQIMRTFVQFRELLATHEDLARRMKSLETRQRQHDEHFQVVFTAIQKLMEPPPDKPKRRMGFLVDDEE